MKGFGLGPPKSKLQKSNVFSAFGKDKPKGPGPQKITIELKSAEKIENDIQTLYPVQARPSRPTAEDSEEDDDDSGDKTMATSSSQSGGWTGSSVSAPASVSQHIMEAPISSLTLRALQVRFAGQKSNLETAERLLEKTDMFDPLLDAREARVKALKAEIELIKSRLKLMEAGKTQEDIEEEAAMAQAEAQLEAARESERTLSLAKNFISWTQGGVYTGEEKKYEKNKEKGIKEKLDRRKEERRRQKKIRKQKENDEDIDENEDKKINNGEDFFEFDTSASEDDGAGSEDGQVGIERNDCFIGSQFTGKIPSTSIVEVLYTQGSDNEGSWIDARIEEAYPPKLQGLHGSSLDDLDYEESYLVTWLHPTQESMVLCPRYKGGSSAERGKFSRCPDKDCPNHHGSRYPIRRVRKHRHHEELVAAKGVLDLTAKEIEFSRGDAVLALHRSAGLWFEAKVLRVKPWAEALNNNVQVEYKIDDDDNNRRKWVSVHEVTNLPERGTLDHLRIVISAMDQRDKFRLKRRQERREKRQAERAILAAVAKRERSQIREKHAAKRLKREIKLQKQRLEAEEKLQADAEAKLAPVPPPSTAPPACAFSPAQTLGGSLDQYINKLYGTSSLDEYVKSYQPDVEMSESSASEEEETEQKPLGRREKARLARQEKIQKRKLEKEQKEARKEKEERQEEKERTERMEHERLEKAQEEKENEQKRKEEKENEEKDKKSKKNKRSESPKKKHKKSRSNSREKDGKKDKRSKSKDKKKKKKKVASRSKSRKRNSPESASPSPSAKNDQSDFYKAKNKADKSRSKTPRTTKRSRSRGRKNKHSSRSRSARRKRGRRGYSTSRSSSSSTSRSQSRSRSQRKRRKRSPERKRTPSAERKAKKAVSAIDAKLKAQIERAQELIQAVTNSIQLTEPKKEGGKKLAKPIDGEAASSNSDAEISPDPVSEEEPKQEESVSEASEADDGGIFKQYEWTHVEEEHQPAQESSEAAETKEASVVEETPKDERVDTVTVGGPSEDVQKPPPAAKIGDWEQHTRGIGLKLLTKMGYSDGVGLGKSQQGRLEPIPVDAELSNQTLSLDFHTNAKLRKEAEAAELESRREKKRKLKKKLLHLPTQKGMYTTAEKVGEFGVINSLFGSSDPVGEEVTDMDARPDPPPVTKKVNAMGFISGGNMPEYGEGPPPPSVAVAVPKGKISDMFMLEQDIAYQREKVQQLTEQYLRHKNDWTAGPIFKQSLVEAKGKLTKLESQMTTLQGSLRHDRDKKNKHSKTKKLF